MIEISLRDISKTYGINQVLTNISLEVKTGEKIAIIGNNGCGKSTLLKIIMKIENPDSGIVTIRKKQNIGYLSQSCYDYQDYLVKDIFYHSFQDVKTLSEQLHKAEEMMNNNQDLTIINKFLSIQERFMQAGGYELETKIDKIVNGFHINHLLNQTFKDLSGGEQKRVLLAAILIKEPDLLLLDEPTNYLDIASLEWLEDFLRKDNGTIIIVSHDRYFLDQICTKTILIENGQLFFFYGNYSYYLKENALRLEKEFKDYQDQHKLIISLNKKVKQLEEFGRLAYPCGESFFRRAENIRKRIAKINVIKKPVEKKKLPITLSANERSGREVLIIHNYNLIVDNRLLIKNINKNIYYGNRICLLGTNGSGKTSLIKQIINHQDLNLKIGKQVKIGYIPQQIEFNDNITIVDFIKKDFIGDESQLRSFLAKFYFWGDYAFKKINQLSGGEKVRLKLMTLINEHSNFIILDEPTNYLDIDTKELLEEALQEFNGTLLFVSHDRYFINKLANKLWVIDNMILTEYQGNYDYYKEKVINK